MALVLAVLLPALLATQTGCSSGGKPKALIVAGTSDLQETGILEAWIRDFNKKSGLQTQLVTATDEEVLAMARHGECDVLITHLPKEEEGMQRSNYVQGREEVMQDDYVLVGPPNDPAGIRGAPGAADAFKKIGEAKAPFVLRVDGSGTAYRAAELWVVSGIEDFGSWLTQTGAGMADTLRLASQKGAYTLSDRSNYENLSGELNLDIIFEDRKGLVNPYSVMEVSQLFYPDSNLEGAQKFASYLLSDQAQRYFSLGAWEPPPSPSEGGQ